MEQQPGNMHWLQNNNENRQLPQRPGSGGRPNNGNGQGQPRPANNLNRWLLLLVGVMLALLIFNYVSTQNQNNTASSTVDLSYTEFYQQIQAKNVETAKIIGITDITGILRNPVRNQTNYHVTQLPNGDDVLPQALIKSGAGML